MMLRGFPVDTRNPTAGVEKWQSLILRLKLDRMQGRGPKDLSEAELAVLREAYAALHAIHRWEDECADIRLRERRKPVLPDPPQYVMAKMVTTLQEWNKLMLERHGGSLFPKADDHETARLRRLVPEAAQLPADWDAF